MSKRGKGRGRGRGRGSNLDQQLESNLKVEPTLGRQDAFPSLPQHSALGITRELTSETSHSASPLSEVIRSVSAGKGRGRKQQRPIPDDTCEELSKQLQETTLQEQDESASFREKPKTVAKFAPRPNFGTAGRPIELISNYFALKFKAGMIYHYDVEIISLNQVKKYGKPVKKMTAAEAQEAKFSRLEHQLDKNVGKLKCREVFDRFVKSKAFESYNPVYDGVKNIFTSKPLPFDSKVKFVIEMEANDKMRQYEVIIQPVRKESGTNATDLNALLKTYEGQNEFIMALSAVMNHREPGCSQIQLGRSFFYLNQPNKVPLGEGLEIWFGYNQSIHITNRGPAVVLNLAAKAFHKAGPVIDYVSDVLRRDIIRGDPVKQFEAKKIDEAMKGLKVHVTHLSYRRKFVVQGISKLSAEDLKINFDGKEISIAQYFQSKYHKLKYPRLPCLFMRTSNNQTYIPLEHCLVIEGQPKLGKLSGQLTAKMIKQTAVNPTDRFRAIDDSARKVQKESGKQMENYKLFMDLVPQKVGGRIINSPVLSYFDNKICDPDTRGVWRIDGKSFYKASIDIESWIMLCFSENTPMSALDKFIDIFTRTGKKVGLNFGRLLDVRTFGRRDTVEKALHDAKQTNAKFAVIVLSRRDNFHNYDEIKFIADYKLSFVTQCIEDTVLGRINEQVAVNICLKINVKLGGVNHILKNKPRIFAKPVIILGADAVHSPRGSGCPSIAAVVGSMDALPSKYKVECRTQENPDGNKISQEIILDIKQMVKNLLTAFYHSTKGKYPEKIIFFRDGVSEGQFQLVRDREVSEVQKASQEVIGTIVPITYIVVQKRHQRRFRPCNPRDGVGRGGNIPPGTTVDQGITHPDLFDYFLTSHEGIQGTSKPAHYTVLHDDNHFDADEIQMLCYHLCFMYGKCNRSISIPAPVMYADLACYRAKRYADFHIYKESSSSGSGSRLPEHVRLAIDSMGQYKNNMFFI
ncbi:Protein argonaute-2 [Araneus ventricosus]|uniref:Protein argonaute-2 n=1 Tax=Araneus ventricosus TaxID=182803 RepID=A0A4Y2C3R7_ARAVE|nr:Protein argonaute-2 [Araneus ventricosus]